jgi:hypothetical protein
MISDKGLLYIEPSQPASTMPVIDDFTRKMAAAFGKARLSDWAWCSVHECVCGAVSTSHDYCLPNGEVTNSLCVHYVAHHRSEVPAGQLARIKAFTLGEAEPPAKQLQGPEVALARARARIKNWLKGNRLNTWTTWGLDRDGLSQNLRGGCLPAGRGYSPERRDAEDLLTLLSSIQADELPCIKAAMEQAYGDVRQWGQQALRHLGWDRGLWVAPFVALIQCREGWERRSVAWSLELLGPAAAVAVPALLDLAKKETEDRDYQEDLRRIAKRLAEKLGLPLEKKKENEKRKREKKNRRNDRKTGHRE